MILILVACSDEFEKLKLNAHVLGHCLGMYQRRGQGCVSDKRRDGVHGQHSLLCLRWCLYSNILLIVWINQVVF
jgi:hypothetical protein